MAIGECSYMARLDWEDRYAQRRSAAEGSAQGTTAVRWQIIGPDPVAVERGAAEARQIAEAAAGVSRERAQELDRIAEGLHKGR